MKVKTSELSGVALDFTVESIELDKAINNGEVVKDWYHDELLNGERKPQPFSSDWLRAGPIIERELISVGPVKNQAGAWASFMLPESSTQSVSCEFGSTALESAMRCYVASVHGDEVEIPAVWENQNA